MIDKPQKAKRSTLKAKCDRLASAYYRAETPYCELAGKDTIRCGGPLSWMHIVGRANLRIRYEPYNKLIGCAGHHVYYTHNPEKFLRFVEQWFPDRLEQIEAHRNELTKVDYDYWIQQFQTTKADHEPSGLTPA